jgi:uncharacterized protein (DUF2147 family)
MLKVGNIFFNFTLIIMKRYAFLLSIMISTAAVAAQAGDSDRIVGLWKSSNKQVMIKIDKVGDHFQGRIVWIGDSEQGGMLMDEKNPNQQLRNLPLKGNKIIQDLAFNPSSAHWEGGTFYNFSEGKNYNCLISMTTSDQIKITKYVQNQQDGSIESWTRQK